MKIKQTIIKELRIVPNPTNEKERLVYRVVRWNNLKPVFEKRLQFKKGNEWRNSKLKPLSPEDIIYIEKETDNIVDILTDKKYNS